MALWWATDIRQVGTRALRQAQEQVKYTLAFQHLSLCVAADGVEYNSFNVGNIQAKTLRGDAVDGNVKGRLAQFLEDADIGDAGYFLQLCLYLLGLGLQHVEIITEDFYRVLALDAGQRFVNVVLDVL